MQVTMSISGLMDALSEIRSLYDVDRILLFGSHARGKAEKESDIDICIILNSRTERLLQITRFIRLHLFNKLHRSMDILVYDKQNFEDRRAAGASFEMTISREGLAL
jgi:predicted nucleotidyltransferase